MKRQQSYEKKLTQTKKLDYATKRKLSVMVLIFLLDTRSPKQVERKQQLRSAFWVNVSFSFSWMNSLLQSLPSFTFIFCFQFTEYKIARWNTCGLLNFDNPKQMFKSMTAELKIKTYFSSHPALYKSLPYVPTFYRRFLRMTEYSWRWVFFICVRRLAVWNDKGFFVILYTDS